MRQINDDNLWRLAQKRVSFRRHFVVYILVNIALIALWYFTSYQRGETAGYWFVYPLFGWGIGVAFHYWNAFHDDDDSVDKEYKKMRKRQQTRASDNTSTSEQTETSDTL